jgi:hypothetical protein
MLPRNLLLAALVFAALIVAGCGGSPSSSKSSGSTATGPGALSGEAASAATGDIPDNQVFLTFNNAGGGYAMRYPEGWAQRGSGRDVTFQDKNNLVHIVVSKGGAPSPASVKAQLNALEKSNRTLRFQLPQTKRVGASQTVKATYTTRSTPNPVTGKRVTLIVDRYVLARGGNRAIVDLGTPKGVDNVDAYRMMIESFRWR